MFRVIEKHTVYLYPGVTDFRLGIYGLRKLSGNAAKENSIYIFANKTLNAIKVIEIEANAFWLYQKKLHRGKFSSPKTGDIFTLSPDKVNYIIEGVSFINKIELNGKTFNRKFY